MSHQELRTAIDLFEGVIARHGGDTSAIRAVSSFLAEDDDAPVKDVLKAAQKAAKDRICLAGPMDVRAGAAVASLVEFERLAEGFGAKSALLKQSKELRAVFAELSEWPLEGVAEVGREELEKKRAAASKRAAKSGGKAPAK